MSRRWPSAIHSGPAPAFAFVLIRDKEIIIEAKAHDLKHAEAILRPDRSIGEVVVSKESALLGIPRPLENNRCLSCGVRKRKEGYDRCPKCIDTKRRIAIQHGSYQTAAALQRRTNNLASSWSPEARAKRAKTMEAVYAARRERRRQGKAS